MGTLTGKIISSLIKADNAETTIGWVRENIYEITFGEPDRHIVNTNLSLILLLINKYTHADSDLWREILTNYFYDFTLDSQEIVLFLKKHEIENIANVLILIRDIGRQSLVENICGRIPLKYIGIPLDDIKERLGVNISEQGIKDRINYISLKRNPDFKDDVLDCIVWIGKNGQHGMKGVSDQLLSYEDEIIHLAANHNQYQVSEIFSGAIIAWYLDQFSDNVIYAKMDKLESKGIKKSIILSTPRLKKLKIVTDLDL